MPRPRSCHSVAPMDFPSCELYLDRSLEDKINCNNCYWDFRNS